jgi:hypothetical protein
MIEEHIQGICPRMEAKVAIVIPFHGDDVSKVIANIKRWNEVNILVYMIDISPI